MTTYGAFDAGLPCKNTACASHGKPHPNCRCYGDMAEGGEVAPFCTTSRAHERGCEYFQEGGEVGGTNDEPPETLEAAGGTNDEPPGTIPDGGTDEEPPEPTGEAGGYSLPTSLGDAVERLGGSGLFQGDDLTQPKDGERITDEQINLMARQNEDAAKIAGLVTGGGVVGAAAEMTGALEGSKFLQAALQGGIIQVADEVSQMLMGEKPESAVGSAYAMGANFLFSGLMGAGAGKLSDMASSRLASLAEARAATKATSFLAGLGYAAKGGTSDARAAITEMAGRENPLDVSAVQNGMKYFRTLVAPSTGALMGAKDGWDHDGVFGALTGAAGGLLAGLGFNMAVKGGSKTLAPALLWVLSKGTTKGMARALDHAAQVAHGSRQIDKAIGFIGGKAPAAMSPLIDAFGGGSALKKELDAFFGDGGMTQSTQEEIYEMNGEAPPDEYAEGGEVQKTPRKPQKGRPKPLLEEDDGVGLHYPAQAMLLSTARGRVSNYMMGLRPGKNLAKLPFDDEPDTREQKRTYDRALAIAAQPLSVMHEIQKGTVEPEHIQHLTAMYPELATELQKRATRKILEAQLEGRKPPYKVRQGLSMLVGAPLSGEMTPRSIQAAQAVFVKAAPPPEKGKPGSPGSGGDKAKLSKADQAYQTGSQARERRSQRPT